MPPPSSVIIVLFAFSAVLALSETAFVRASRIRMLNLAEEGDKRAERCAAPARASGADAQLRAARPARVPDDLGHVARHRARTDVRHRRARGRHGHRDHGRVHVRRGRAQDVCGAAPRSRGDVGVGAARVPHALPRRCASYRGFIGLANIVLPGKGLRGGPFVTEEDLLTMADVAARGGLDRKRGARAHPLDLRVR